MISDPFDWRTYLKKPDFRAAPVSCFKHVAHSNCWDKIITEKVYLEVRSPDCEDCSKDTTPCCYWIAYVVKVCGFMTSLRLEGADSDEKDYWINLCTEKFIRPIGWCSESGISLVPPKNSYENNPIWRQFLVDRLTRSRTIPADFTAKIHEQHSRIKPGMKLEVVDKNLISTVRVATVTEVVGGRLHVVYDNSEEGDVGFWCHELSPLIHPVGWAQVVGHALKSTNKYARKSLEKTLYRQFEPNDATWDLFMPVPHPVQNLTFKEGMKLEAIDPLNLSTICVATVTEVLRNNYLMIGIDGMMAANGDDCFCYHASSPCIFPVGFCESNSIHLTPPSGYKGDFKWSEYLKKTKSRSAPVGLFEREIPNHGFEEGMYLEAVDLMEPRLICVAKVTKVVGRLLKVHFEGWEDAYDQWCDCESPDLFPVGWCEAHQYRLEPPRIIPEESRKKKKLPMTKGKRKRRKFAGRRKKTEDDSMLNESLNDLDEDSDSMDVTVVSDEDSSSNCAMVS